MSSSGAKKLYQGVANDIANAIVAGRYAAGSKLPSERELTEIYEVSRATIREAMIALAIRGIVEERHNAGVFVAKESPPPAPEPDLDIGAFELTEARKLIEGESAALAAKCITDAELADLYRLVGRMEHDFERDVEDDTADRDFHFLIARATRNAAMLLVIETLWNLRYKAPLTREIFHRARMVGISSFLDDHRAVADALAARDPAAARAAMQLHLSHVMEELLTATETEVVRKARDEIEQRRRELLWRSQS